MIRRALIRGLAGLALVAAALSPRPVGAVTQLNGEYNLQLDVRKQDRGFEWDFDSNNNDTYSNVQFRLLSTPRPGVEAFAKTEAEWNSNDNNGDRPMFVFREAHLRYRFELNKGQRGFDSYLFSRQSRFWVDNYLIQVVRDGEANDGGNAQGVRVESWGFLGGLKATAIVSDYSSQYNAQDFCSGCSADSLAKLAADQRRRATDDGMALRLRRDFGHNRLRTGFTFNRKSENQLGEEQGQTRYAQVFAGDARYTLGNTDISFEYAQSHTNGPGPGIRYTDGLDQKLMGFTLPNGASLQTEVRSLKFGTASVGYLNVAPRAWVWGPQFDNRMGESNRDERGYLVNTWYLVPQRSITLTNNWLEYRKKATLRRKVTEYYGEAYIEFINGFTGKVFYRRHRTEDEQAGGIIRLEKNDDVVALLTVESRLAWMRISGKIKNMNTTFEKQLAALETSVNLTGTTKLFTRLTLGNDPTGLRRALFTQLQYRPTANMELFLEYGPGWIGDSPLPVDDGDLEGNSKQKEMIKLWLKGNF